MVFDPGAVFTVDATRLRQRHPITPYAGRRLVGRVERVYLRGECEFDGAEFPGTAAGRMLIRPAGRAPVDAPGRKA